MNVGRRTFLLASLGAALVACGSEEPQDDTRVLTAEQAELLGGARFQLFRRGTVPVRMELPGNPSATIIGELALDQALGYGTLTFEAQDGVPAGRRVIGWTTTTIATAGLGADDAVPSADTAAWSTRPLTTTARQDIFLGLALNLGTDRPENPLLLRRGTARYLRDDQVDGVDVAVFQGARPAGDTKESRTRFWIDADGNLLRFQADLGDAQGRLATITVVGSAEVPRSLRESAATVLKVATKR